MKILMLGWELPPYNSGGLGVACYQLCKALSNKSVDIEFILPYRVTESPNFMKVTAASQQNAEAVSLSGIAYDSSRYKFEDGHEEWLDMFSQQQMYEHAVERLAGLGEFDVIHAHDWLTFRAAMKAKQRSGLPLVVHVHSVESDRSGGLPGNPMVVEIEEMGLLMADCIIAVSEFTKQAIMRDYKIPADKIEVVHNSIDRDELEPIDGDNAYHYLSALRNQGYHIVTNIGRLTIQKGLTNLLRSAQAVIHHNPKTMFLIVGSGDQYNELMELSAELGIQANVILAGFQRGKQWRDAFAIADLFVMPSVSEPFGLTPLEAIHYGTPSLISNQAGVSEVFKNCLKVDFWDTKEMANKISGVLENIALHDELRDNAVQELQKISWDYSADKLVNIYKKHSDKVLA